MERIKNEALMEKDAAKNAVSALTREVEWLRKQTDVEKADIMKLVRDRDIIKRTLGQVAETNSKNRSEIIQKEQTIQTTLEQNNKYKENIQQLLKSVKDISKERDTHQKQAAKNNAQLMQMVEEVKLKKNLLSEMKKENIEFEAKLKQQQNLYEAVRSEKNLYSKNLLEAQDDVAELNRKFKIAQHQIT
jgi:chromosome segregation ATPase